MSQSWPDKKYQIIYADPPWRYNDRNCGGAARSHYQDLKLWQIKELPVPDICATDSVLLLWATFPMLQEAFEVIKAWGFRYKSIGFLWLKQNRKKDSLFYGLGRWTRGNAEPCLLATKGSPKRVSRAVHQIVFHPIGKHSQKPPEAREKIIELLGDKSRIELFARDRVKGWDAWGNEIPEKSFNEVVNA